MGYRSPSIDWRANRLVDAVAKYAANVDRVSADVTKLLDDAAAALEFYAARFGTISHTANHYQSPSVLPEGTTVYTCLRDSCPDKPVMQGGIRKKRYAAEVVQVVSAPPGPTPFSVPIEIPSATYSKPKVSKRQRHEDHEADLELRFQENWSANRPNLQPAPFGQAQARVDAMRERVRLRYAGGDGLP